MPLSLSVNIYIYTYTKFWLKIEGFCRMVWVVWTKYPRFVVTYDLHGVGLRIDLGPETSNQAVPVDVHRGKTQNGGFRSGE